MNVKQIGLFLAQLRKERNLTQEQLGEVLSVSNKTISRWETGAYLPPVEMLQELSIFYDISINELLSGRRLNESEYRRYAEENMKCALAESSFTLKEKIGFFKQKWKKEHIGLFVFGVLVTVVLYIAGIFLWNGIQILGYFWMLGFLLVQRNRMMAYVEERAFDGSGRQ